MKFLDKLLLSFLMVIIVYGFFSTLLFLKARAEKKLLPKESIKTRNSKLLYGFFLGFGLLVLCGGTAGIIYSCIADGENTDTALVVVLSIGVVVFSAIGFFGYAYTRFNYVVADNEGLLAYRLFRKKKYYRYEDIGYFQDTISLGIRGGLTGYDKTGQKIFAIEAISIGATAVAQRLREHGVKEKIQF